jgi:nitroimidazol reductase NimA-like FMN-containing flavoprotein (pyridoxamine 5'-phosphate oxidase superfamily)
MGDAVNLDDFLARPLVARVATNGPTVRPVWFIFEERAFWWLTKTGTVLANAIERGEPICLVVDCCDLQTGEVIKVSATGRAEILALDRERAMRKFVRYLGPDPSRWDSRFMKSLADPSVRFARLMPTRMDASDMSFEK